MSVPKPDVMWNACIALYTWAVAGIVMALLAFRANFEPMAAAMVLIVICFVTLKLLRKHYPWMPSVFFPLGVLTWVVMIWFVHEGHVHANAKFFPFAGSKILALAVAMAAPPDRRIGIFSFVLIGAAPLLQYALWPPEYRLLVGSEEPWVTLVFVIVAVFLWVHRVHLVELRWGEAQAEANATAYRGFAHLLLGAQHVLNTPLQTIEATVQLIRTENPETAKRVDAIDRAFQTVRRISQLLAFGESHVRWDAVKIPGSIETLEREFQELMNVTPPRAGNQMPITQPNQKG